MKTTDSYFKLVEWLSAEDMHQSSKQWLSELNFMKDEHHFFEDLITSFTHKLIDPNNFEENKKVINAINHSKKENLVLINEIIEHEKELRVMVDGIDQPEKEREYKNEHRRLIRVFHRFRREYRELKSMLFKIIKDIRVQEKRSRLLDQG